MTTEKPRYSRKPVGSVGALGFVTDTPPAHLLKLAKQAPTSYRVVEVKESTKTEGLTKVTYEPKPRLKAFQRKLIETILAGVEFPAYLSGGVRGCSYRDDCAIHVEAQTVIKLDIATFYESVTRDQIEKVWRQFFRFSPSVSELLTALTTHEGHLPRGAPASNYLANLLFWREEPGRCDTLARSGIRYSRYVDDVTLSTTRYLKKAEIEVAIALVYGMFKGKGIKPNRAKERILRLGGPLRVHNINVGGAEPAIPKQSRDEIRAGLYNLGRAVSETGVTADIQGRVNHLRGKAAWLKHFHPEQGIKAQAELTKILISGG